MTWLYTRAWCNKEISSQTINALGTGEKPLYGMHSLVMHANGVIVDSLRFDQVCICVEARRN